MKKALVLCLAVVLTVSMFGGWAMAEAPAINYAELPTIDIKVAVYGNNMEVFEKAQGSGRDRILNYLEEKFNVRFSFYTGATGWLDAITADVASGSSPEILWLPLWSGWGGDALYRNLMKDNPFADIGQLIADNPGRYPAIELISQDPFYKFNNEKWNGGADNNYGVFNLSTANSPYGAPIFNKKHLDAVGKAVPTTIEEFIDVLRALKNGDPDANGVVGDTIPYGWNTNKGASPLNTDIETIFFGSEGTHSREYFPDADGVWHDYHIYEANREIFKKLAELYKEGLFDAEVFTRANYANVDLAAQGTMSVVGIGTPNGSGTFYDTYFKRLSAGTAGGKTPADWPMPEMPLIGFSGGYATTYGYPMTADVINVIPADCEDPARVLDVLNYLASDEGMDLVWYGIEGVHYALKADGTKLFDYAEYLKDCGVYNVDPGRGTYTPFYNVIDSSNKYVQFEKAGSWVDASLNGAPLYYDRMTPTVAKVYGDTVIANYKEFGYKLMPFYAKGIVLSQELNDAKTKINELYVANAIAFITGAKNLDADWDAYVAEVKALGSDAIVEQYATQAKELEARFGTK